LARILEERNIATVIIAIKSFQPAFERMRVPRLVSTPFPMGRPLGFPGDGEQKKRIISTALDLIDRATTGGSFRDFAEPYFPGS
jgi:hypothetical protein